ncbi:Type 2A phosphatase-associated protein 42 [Umbelopsis nana]
MERLSLSELYNRGQRIFINVRESTFASADPQLQSQIEEGIAYLERASDLVQRLGIFSENEFLDDINANDLRFLLVNAYLGSLILQRTGSNRKAILESSKKHLLEFLNTCEVHQIIPESDTVLLKRFQDTDTAPRLDAATSREQKIERYKREKEMEGKIKDLQAVLDKAGEKSGETDVDIEDIERDLVMSLVNFHILKSMEHLQSIGQEYVMVLEMEKMRERAALGDATDLRSHTAQPKIDPRNASGPLLSSTGVPLRPFVITSKRQELRDQVFRPGWALPTMTIDEYLQQEEERGNIIKGGGKEQPEKPEIDDNDHEALDAETMKSRDWDVYKEDNPRGWGNRGNKG